MSNERKSKPLSRHPVYALRRERQRRHAEESEHFAGRDRWPATPEPPTAVVGVRLPGVRYQEAFRRAAESVAFVDVDGVIRELNQAFAALVGTSVGSLRGRALASLLAEGDAASLPARLRSVVSGEGGIAGWQTALRTGDGRVLSAELRVQAVIAGGAEAPCLAVWATDAGSGPRARAALTQALADVEQLQARCQELRARLTAADGEVQALRQSESQLRGLVRDLGEQRRSEEEHADIEARVHRLSAHLQAVREEESTKIAREIHDELGGNLTVLKLGLTSMLKKTGEADWVHAKAASLLSLTDAAIQTVRRISTTLRPGMLDTLGLMATVKWHAAEFSQLTGIPSEVQLPEYIRLSPERSTAVYRIIQEALTNVARHSEATRVCISVEKSGGELLVEIRDNGKGLGAMGLTKADSYGILGMHERCQYLGGELSIAEAPEGGTLVRLRVPLSDRRERDAQ